MTAEKSEETKDSSFILTYDKEDIERILLAGGLLIAAVIVFAIYTFMAAVT